ncbi:hypothetical protein FB451DRAFT_1180482 [Mycena latifolia]|nr:hypothetical protein FB451DRAFT_1180482 [Mycena latifolia]
MSFIVRAWKLPPQQAGSVRQGLQRLQAAGFAVMMPLSSARVELGFQYSLVILSREDSLCREPVREMKFSACANASLRRANSKARGPKVKKIRYHLQILPAELG